jgi:hypothetical protein
MTAGVAGLVWVDTNDNGRCDSGEPPLPGVTVTLQGQDLRGQTVEIVLATGSDGTYRFANLPGGTYEVIQTQPSSFHDGRDSLGTVAGVRTGVLGNDRATDIVLRPTQQAVDYNFGERGLQAKYVTARMFLASSPPVAQTTRAMVAQGAKQDGNLAQAWVIEEAKAVEVRRIGAEVTVTGSSGSDEITFVPAGSSQSGSGSQHTLQINGVSRKFPAAEVKVIKLVGNGGRDQVVLNDSRGDDRLEVDGDKVQLANGDFWLQAVAFDVVRAIASSGGNDNLKKKAADFVLELQGTWHEE